MSARLEIDREAAIALLVSRMLSEETAPAPEFWLGAMEPWWAWEGEAQGRIILSARRVLKRMSKGRGRLRRALVPVFLDSGAFSELAKHDRWMWPPADFVEFVVMVCRALGTVEHVGIQDWMCEPFVIARTGLTVEEHQRRTVANFCLLRRLARSVPWPVCRRSSTPEIEHVIREVKASLHPRASSTASG